MFVSFLSAILVSHIFRSDKYLASDAWIALKTYTETHVGLYKVPVIFIWH
jgi:hypothetical protein